MAEQTKNIWETATLGDNDSLKELFDAASTAAVANQTALTLAKTQYEAGKILALAAIDPVFAAVNIVIDLVDNVLKDLENIGFYTLSVNSETMAKSESARAATLGSFFYGGEVDAIAYIDEAEEHRGLINLKSNPKYPPRSSATKTFKVGTSYDEVDIDAAGSIAKDEDDNKIYVKVPYFTSDSAAATSDSNSSLLKSMQNLSGPTLNTQTGLLETTPSDIISTMVSAFDDEGDVLKIYLDEDDKPVDNENDAAIYEGLPKFSILDNKPTFSDNSVVGGFVWIIGAPSLSVFAEAIGAFSQLLNVRELKDYVGKLLSIWNIDPIIVNVIDCITKDKQSDSSYTSVAGGFSELLATYKTAKKALIVMEVSPNTKGSGIIGRKAFVGEIKEVKYSEKMVINRVLLGQTLASDANTKGYKEETITIQPFSRFADKPLVGNLLVEAIVDTSDQAQAAAGEVAKTGSQDAAALSTDANYTADQQDWQPKTHAGPDKYVVGRIMNQTEIAESVPPDFNSYTIKELIPVYGIFLKDLRTNLNALRGLTKSSQESIQETIDYIDKKVEEAEGIAKTILKIQKVFAGLSKAGIYSLYLAPEVGGTAGFKTRLQAATNMPPNTLKFSAGMLMVGGTPDVHSGEAMELAVKGLGKLLGLSKE